jgi:hypothetical protein
MSYKYLVEYSKVEDMDTREKVLCNDEELMNLIKNRIQYVVWSAEWVNTESLIRCNKGR